MRKWVNYLLNACIKQVASSTLRIYHNATSDLKCTKATLQIPEGSNRCPSYPPLAPLHLHPGSAVPLPWEEEAAQSQANPGSPAAFQQSHQPRPKRQREPRGQGTSPLPAGPPQSLSPNPASSSRPALCFRDDLRRIKGFSPLLFPGCFTTPCLLPAPAGSSSAPSGMKSPSCWDLACCG